MPLQPTEELLNTLLLLLILREVRLIRKSLTRAESATLTFINSKGEKMPATIAVGKQAQATFTEWDGPNGTGNKVPPTGAVAFESDNPAVATVDPSTGVCTGVSGGIANISGLDQGNNLSASDVLTVQAAPPPPTAQSATLTLQAI
jgi:Big-like domain-containing protein